MTTKRVTMIKLKEILRLKFEAQLSLRQIASCLGLSVGVISKYLQRAQAAGLGWPLPEGMTEVQLQDVLQPPRKQADAVPIAEPDFDTMEDELKTKGMTRQLLWEEYAASNPDNHYSYSRYTVLFKRWRRKQQLDAPAASGWRKAVHRLLRANPVRGES